MKKYKKTFQLLELWSPILKNNKGFKLKLAKAKKSVDRRGR